MSRVERQIDEQQIARRFAALAPEARRGFIEKLRVAGLNFGELPIVPTERGARPQLSYSQRGLWLTWRLDPDSPAYNMPGALTLEGALNELALDSALHALLARHEVLRTVYLVGEDGEPFQHVLEGAVVKLASVDLSSLPPEARESALQQHKIAFARKPFRLDADLPLRACLWRLGESTHVLGLALHHIAGDGASIAILIDELLALYEAACAGAQARLACLPIQFADHAAWQRNWFEAGERDRQLAYWRGKLGSEHPPTVLPLDRPRGGQRSVQTIHAQEGKLAFEWTQELSDAIRQLARQQGASAFMAVLALLKLTLYRISGDAEQRIGSPIANRQRAETTGLIGFLTNVQVLCTRITPSSDFPALLAAVRDTVLDAQMHPDLPFDMLVEALQPHRQPGVHPLFQVKCTQQDGLPAPRQVAGLKVGVQAMSGGRAHFDLSLDFVDRPQGLVFEMAFDRDLFDIATIERLAQAFTQLSHQVAKRPTAGVTEWPVSWPQAALQGPDRHFADADVLAMWQRARRAKPDQLCVSDERRALTQADVHAQSDELAARLAEQGIGVDDRVAILAERSCEFLLGVLAVLKAGAAYVPLDPRLPTHRLRHQVADSGARVLLSDQAWPDSPSGLTTLPIACEAQPSAPITPRSVHAGQAAYVIYTSGSTGVPKGVVVSRGALANYVQAMLERLALPDDAAAMAMISTVGADLGHTSFFGALCSGRTLHMVGSEVAFDPDRFAALMAQHRIDVLKIVPSHLQALMHAASPADVLPRHALILGGEVTPWSLLERIRALRPDCRVFNHYGPTETTVGALMQDATTADAQTRLLPLGTPLANAQALVLGPDMQLLPHGMAGELFIGGAGVARGYQDRPGQTAERFVAHPFAPGARLYRTGDRVRQGADGSLVFLGRLDDQVKVRGHRVELQEIAQVIRAQAGVCEAEVIARDAPDGRQRLLAYVVPTTPLTTMLEASDGQSSTPVPLSHLREALSRVLPDHMVPTAIVAMEALPLTPNGKVDRKSLPEPPADVDAARSGEQDAPRGLTEQALADIWAQVLKLPRLGRHDNYFDLGGDSILTLQIVARARKRGLLISPKQLLSLQTVAALAEVIAETPATNDQARLSAPPASQPDAAGFFELTPVQRWFFEQRFDEPHHWNQSVLLDACVDLTLEQVREAVARVVARHDALRLCFEHHEGRWRQRVTPTSELDGLLRCVRLEGMVSGRVHPEQEALGLAARAAIEDAQRCLSLSRPFKAIWLDGGRARPGQLLLVAHHLVVDAVSWRIIIEDLGAACQVRADEGLHQSTSWSAWSQAWVSHAARGAFREELPHWQAQAAKPDDDLPGRLHEPNLVADARTIDAALSAEATTSLLSQAPVAYRTQVNDLLLTALARALCAWSGKQTVLIELEGHGRESDGIDDMDLSRTVGWFTTLFPVRLNPGQGDVGESIRSIKDQLRQVPNKGIGYGVLRHLSEQGTTLKEGPSAQITFNYLGQVDGHEQGPGSIWCLSEIQPHEQRSPGSPRRTWIDAGAMVRDGRLQVRWTYSERIHDAETMGQLVDAFIGELHALIAHCAEEGNHGLTPSDLPLAGLSQAQLNRLALPDASLAQLADLYPLSPMQAGMLFHNAFDPGGTSYTNQVRIDIDGLDADRFTQAWQVLMTRHEVLRTGFIHVDGKPLQWVVREVPLPLTLRDERATPDQQGVLDALAAQDLARGFDLAKPPLMRLTLVRIGDQRHHLIWTRHHLLMDGWSTSLLMAEMLTSYRGESLPPRHGRFRDHIAWLQTRDHGAATRHWQALLGELQTPTLLAAALPPPMSVSGHLSLMRVIDAVGTASLQAFARQARVTVNTLVQAAWSLLLQRYTGQQTVCFGATTSGRPAELAGAERMLGLFINTLPVTAQPSAGQDKVEWLQALQAQNAASREHEQVSLAEIQRCARAAGGKLFDSIVVFENYPVDEVLRASQQPADRGPRFQVRQVREETNYPMTLSVNLGQTLSIEYAWAGQCFSREQIERLASHVEALLLGLADPACRRLGELSMLRDSESSALTKQGHGTEVGAHDAIQLPVHQKIAQQAALRQDALALVCGDRSCTHAELDARVNRLAHRLIRLGVRLEDRVGVAVERGLDMIVSVLAILKAGAAYVPLDPSHPQDRLAFMIEDIGMKLVLAHAATQASLPVQAGVTVIALDELALDDELVTAPEVALHQDSLAYVIYTSGSTGRPKGVGVSHRALARHARVGVGFFDLGPDDRMLQFATLNFDGFIEQVFPALSVGAAVVVRGTDLWDSRTLHRQLTEHGVTVADLTTAYWLLLAQDFAQEGRVETGRLRQVNVGGEAMPPEGLRAWRDAGLVHVKVLNTYGPTEATVTASALDCTPFVDGSKRLPQQMPIGQALGGRVLRVLDADLNPVPLGVVGELAIGGGLLARGYEGRPALTAERFIADPFHPQGARLYRTGDLVRWSEDGELTFLGRVDHQVKIRGLRIEPGEIEAQLLAQAEVKEAVVVARPSLGGVRLIAHVSLHAGQTAETGDESRARMGEALRLRLADELPDYMVPSLVVVHMALPLNPNGKVDRKMLTEADLPELTEATPSGLAETPSLPLDETEQTLAALWQEVLGVQRVGRNENFFALGGHSLLALQLSSLIQRQWPGAMTVRDIFARPVLADMANALRQEGRANSPSAQSLMDIDAFIDQLESA
ncbi:non-ribosomal peptide synthetase [Aquabacterium parvum]|jgi:amino acid adenylation domain-containing protein/non-ribosomal peptide synthase protein (TIGR01720 family)|uniref:non-ribosomal peptide synthetase n=1 Tax=Aquabacterium parvum TaxID=70584 RepID=UPI000718BE49|nr:non-ribosomal peptide synthetase [Aquabacterium parvum]